ncbi:HDIG domain-containing protein [Balneolales bacterium ANBcel1]|nr:HDIG domain-containing protein [Balneolales bacterium ANBcel1]
MSILEKLGLQRKRKAYVPFTTEKMKKEKAPGLFSKNNILMLLMSIAFLVIIIALYPRSPVQDMAYTIGEPWRDDDLTAPFTFSLMKDDSEIQAEINSIRETTPPVFLVEEHVSERAISMLDTLFYRLDHVLDTYLSWQHAIWLEDQEAAESDSLAYHLALRQSGISLDDEAWTTLQNHIIDLHAVNDEQLHRYSGLADGALHNDLRIHFRQLYNNGIIDRPREEFSSRDIIIRNVRTRTEREARLEHVRSPGEAREYLRTRLSDRHAPGILRAALQIANQVLDPSLRFSEQETEALIQDRIDAISPTKGAVSEGQVIIRRGDIITPERHDMIQSLLLARAERTGDIDLWKQYIGETMLVVAVFLIFFFYIYLYRRQIFDQNAMMLLVFLSIVLTYGVGAVVARMDDISPYIVPFAISPILLTIIFDSRVGIMTTSLIALMAGLMFGNSFEFVVATVTACSIGVYSVRDIKDRSQFYLTTPALIYFTYAFVLFGFTLTKVGGWSAYLDNLTFLLGNVVGIWLTYPLILLIEKAFRITTDVTLLELSDTNQPILKKLMLEAPGSFHHSLQVANLAEAAATGIGANSLLARVGALYHDIGKLEKPQYFVENQQSRNAHDKLKPRMSALIIKNHVDVGCKMAEEIELPAVITDFIRTHHGTSLIKFFYEKAINESDNEQEIREEDFRYDGPLPNSKETGILLLADGVEAASRSMSDHSYPKLENLVNRLVDDRLAEGQLNDCALTLKDLNIIKEVFHRILQGMYHGRVKYPGQEEQERKASDTEIPPSPGGDDAPQPPDAGSGAGGRKGDG